MIPTIDNARPEDADALGGILSDWIDETAWMPRLHTRGQDRDFVADLIRAGGVLVARKGQTPVGFLFERHCHLGALYVGTTARRSGVGSRLLDRAKSDCERLNLWTFAANGQARRFYEHAGFRIVAQTEGNNDEGLPDIRMAWNRETENG